MALLRMSPKLRFVIASLSLTLGAILLVVVGLYLFWGARSGDDAEQFNVQLGTEELPVTLGRQAPDEESVTGDREFAALASLYPGSRTNPRYWDSPQFARSDPFGGPAIPDGFEPASADSVPSGANPLQLATGMRIPAIRLDSTVDPLELLDLGDQSAYQTPDNTVGFIPQTGAPGEVQTGWYFGHLEGFVSGEGSVFRRLPEIAGLIREDSVDIFLTTNDAEFMYRVTATKQIPQEELKLQYSDRNDITLVTCWPTRIYDQRIVVSAELIAWSSLNWSYPIP